jgi:hypothetical protein
MPLARVTGEIGAFHFAKIGRDRFGADGLSFHRSTFGVG